MSSATLDGRLVTPDKIRAKVCRRWEDGTLLRAWLLGDPLAPMVLPCRAPSAGVIPEVWDTVKQWIHLLREHSKERLGFGYTIEVEEVNHRRIGRQALPLRVSFETGEDLLRFIGKYEEFRQFCAIAETTLAAWPSLRGWLERSPHEVLKNEGAWSRLLAVLEYVHKNPRPGRYLRELSIAGVDTKFIETHKPLLRELLDAVLPAEAVDATVTGLASRGFEKRYGFRYDEPLIRFRILDPAVLPAWPMRDLSVPHTSFCTLDVPCRRVFITENKMNGLAFPPARDSIVVFGLGYGVSALSEARWLATREIHYWGDIDTHGLAILSLLRGHFPAARSFCMDRPTLLLLDRSLWGTEDEQDRCSGAPPHLTAEEESLYESLRSGELGDRPRLEQERVSWEHVRMRLREVFCDPEG